MDLNSQKIDYSFPLKLIEETLAIIEVIINECCRNEAVRETLHFLNVYCDEVLTVHQQLIMDSEDIASTERML